MKKYLKGMALAIPFIFGLTAANAGPLILMGIDAEDAGPGGHGPNTVYQDVLTSLMGAVTNGNTDVLVFGSGKAVADNVTSFWDAVAAGTGLTIDYVSGAAAITAIDFSSYASIAVVSDIVNTPGGGFTNAENDALAARSAAVANFVNTGGGLLGFSSADLTIPYGYLAGLGAFTFGTTLTPNITPTVDGLAVGITNSLDVCCWHDTFLTFPGYLDVLANEALFAGIGDPTAIGGVSVRIVAVPEPATLALMGLGLLGMGAARRSKKA